jgi:nicotinamide-nucleotide amidase
VITLDLPAIVARAVTAGITVATAESLTAGLVAASLAQVPGASAMLQGGVVAYQNSVKSAVLGVDPVLLERNGSVDAQVAREMALGVCRITGARVGLAATGVAGPEPHDGKPVGTVFLAVALDGVAQSYEYAFTGDRALIRQQACDESLSLLSQLVTQLPGTNPTDG